MISIDRLTLATVRKDAPNWEWTAKRAGMGWHYVGKRDGEEVTVEARALFGVHEDDFFTRWYVYGDGRGEDYFGWVLAQRRNSHDQGDSDAESK